MNVEDKHKIPVAHLIPLMDKNVHKLQIFSQGKREHYDSLGVSDGILRAS